MIKLTEFRDEYGALGLAEFCAREKAPFLVFKTAADPDDPIDFKTQSLDATDFRGGVEEMFLLRVTKNTKRNAFGSMVTLGRASNNDLVIPEKLVSKFHAYLRCDDGTWNLHDANSRHGTWVGEERVESSGKPLPSGTQIRLAKDVGLTFFLPAELHAMIQS